MKLGDMSFEESKSAELLIIPEIEKIVSDKETADLLDGLFVFDTKKQGNIKRGNSSKLLVGRLIQEHWDSTCHILSVLNKMSVDDVKSQKRSEANAQIAGLLGDPDLISFFMSSEALGQAVSSATSQK